MRRRRVIDILRKRYGGHWGWDPWRGIWTSTLGWNVHCHRDDGDDHFRTTYRRSDTWEEIPELDQGRLFETQDAPPEQMGLL
jgi:hypothetical protein